MDVYVVFVVRTVAWNVSWYEGRRDLNSTKKMDQRGKTPGQAKKKIPPGAWMSVSCECCVLSGRGLWDGLITRPEESYRLWCVSSVIVKPRTMRRPRPPRGCRAIEKNIYINFGVVLDCHIC
jgi:hypothetical protein